MKKTSTFIRTYIDVIFFITLMLIKVLMYGNEMKSGYFSYASLFPPVLASILILVAISIIFNSKRRVRFLYICNLVITIFIISDLTYFRYFKDVISIPVLISGLQLGAVKSSVTTLFKLTDLLYAVDFIFILPMVKRYKSKNTLEVSKIFKIFPFFNLFNNRVRY